MATANESVRGRIETVGTTLTPLQIAVGIGLLTLVGSGLLFAPEPVLHDALHDFRHVAGVTCH